MNKTLTFILLSSIFMGERLSARSTFQDVRNAVTVRNACGCAGGIIGACGGFKISTLLDDCCRVTPEPIILISNNRITGLVDLFDFLKPIIGYRSIDRGNYYGICLLQPIAIYFGATRGARIALSLYDRATLKHEARQSNNKKLKIENY